jgi:hypothetical protein
VNKAIASAHVISNELNGQQATLEQGSEWVSVLNVSSTLIPIEVSRQETVNLGDYESARVGCGITAFLTNDQHDEVFVECARIVDLMIDYEIQKLRTLNSDKVIETPTATWEGPPVDLLIVSYHYGMTLNLGDYNSAKMDAGRSYPIKPADLQLRIEMLRNWLRTKLIGVRQHVIHKYKSSKGMI